MNYETTYVVVSHSSFIQELFWGHSKSINEKFHFLIDTNIYEKFLWSESTNFNLNSGHLLYGVGAIDKEIYFNWWDYRSVELPTFKDYAKDKNPDFANFSAPFIPYLGKISLGTNAIPNCLKHTLLMKFAKNLLCGLEGNQFGLFNGNLRRFSHIPLTIGKGKSVSYEGDGGRNKFLIEGSKVPISLKLRTHLFPNGIITKYLIIGINANQGYSAVDISTIVKSLSQSFSGNFNVSGKTFKTVSSLFGWVDNLVYQAITRNGADLKGLKSLGKEFSYVYGVTPKSKISREELCEEFTLILGKPSQAKFNEIINNDYSADKLYQGIMSSPNSKNLLICFGEKKPLNRKKFLWTPAPNVRSYKNNRHSVRAYWSLISVFHFVNTYKHLFSFLLSNVYIDSANLKCFNYNEFIHLISNAFRNLDGPRRKFYYSLADRVSLDKTISDFKTSADLVFEKTEWKDIIGNKALEEKIGIINASLISLKSQHEITNSKIDECHFIINSINIGDFKGSIYENYLTDRLSVELWNTFEEVVKTYLITAEVLFYKTPLIGDYSGAIIEYAKSIEVILNNFIQRKLQQGLIGKSNSEAMKSKHKNLNIRSYTLGSIPYLLSKRWECTLTSKKYQNAEYEDKLSISHFFDENELFTLASEIQTIATIRNSATHSEPIDRLTAQSVREKFNYGTALNAFLTYGNLLSK